MDAILESISLLQAGAFLATVAAVWTFIRKAAPPLGRLKDLIDDFTGEPERPGVPARPGLMARMQALESDVADIRYHSKPNAGGSAYDHLMSEVKSVGEKLDADIAESTADRRNLHADISRIEVNVAPPKEKHTT